MKKPKVTLATSATMPNLYPDEAGLLGALESRGIDPQVRVWNDPAVDWEDAGIVVVRSVIDYAKDRSGFLEWAQSVPRLLNHADVLKWNSDKHYLLRLEELGLPTIPTTWLSADHGYTKHQVHSRFPALGDFIVKPAVSSGVRDVGRYSSSSIPQRQDAISQVMTLLGEGRDVMIQRYLEEVETEMERSLVFFNGILSHAVEKQPVLSPSQATAKTIIKAAVSAREVSGQELHWGEKIRAVIHEYIRERTGRDELLLFTRVDIVPDGQGSFRVMEVALVDADLYLDSTDTALENFVDAISVRAFW